MVSTSFYPSGREQERRIEANSAAWALRQVTAWTWHANGKLATLETRNGAGSVLERHEVGYDDPAGVYVNGHRTQDAFWRAAPGTGGACHAATATCTATYRYDGRDRVTYASNGASVSQQFDPDPAGNLRSETLSEPSGTTTTSFAYAGQQLQSATVQVGAAAALTSRYWYDDWGNLDCVTDDSVSAVSRCADVPAASRLADYDYDFQDQLERFSSYQAGVVDDHSVYEYDALDRVITQTETHASDPAANRVTAYSYLGLSDYVAGEQQRPHAGGTSSTDKAYSYDMVGLRVGMTDTPTGGSAASYTYGYDVHGSASLLVDATGAVKAAYGYKAYGDSDAQLSAGDTDKYRPLNPYRYTAKRFDTGAQAIDMGARRFNPATARFLQADTYLGALDNLRLSTDPLTANRYALAGGNPLSYVEIDGHQLQVNGSGASYPAPTVGDNADTYALPQNSKAWDVTKDTTTGRPRQRGAGAAERRAAGMRAHRPAELALGGYRAAEWFRNRASAAEVSNVRSHLGSRSSAPTRLHEFCQNPAFGTRCDYNPGQTPSLVLPSAQQIADTAARVADAASTTGFLFGLASAAATAAAAIPPATLVAGPAAMGLETLGKSANLVATFASATQWVAGGIAGDAAHVEEGAVGTLLNASGVVLWSGAPKSIQLGEDIFRYALERLAATGIGAD